MKGYVLEMYRTKGEITQTHKRTIPTRSHSSVNEP